MISAARWLGISNILGSRDLHEAIQDFSKAQFEHEKIYLTQLSKISPDNPSYSTLLKAFDECYDRFTNQAEYLHAIITSEILRGIPRWLYRNK